MIGAARPAAIGAFADIAANICSMKTNRISTTTRGHARATVAGSRVG